MATPKKKAVSAWWISALILAATTETSEAWTAAIPATATRLPGPRCARSPVLTTALFAKKKNKKKGGDATASSKMQVKLLQHIPGTGQAGDVIMVSPVFFSNKLRPQKLARKITDEEVQKDLEEKQEKSAALQAEARALKELIDDEGPAPSFFLEFADNQTGPDGKKLFGGIGPKKLMDALRTSCKEFDSYSKKFTKQVSITDIEEREEVERETAAEPGAAGAYKDYSKPDSLENAETEKEISVSYSSLPKKDKMTIKNTGIFRMKISLTKDLFVKVKVVVS